MFHINCLSGLQLQKKLIIGFQTESSIVYWYQFEYFSPNLDEHQVKY